MSKVDIVLALILAIGGYLGYKRGFLMELFYLLAIVLGIFLGFKLMGAGMEMLHREFNADKKFLPYLSFIVIFVAVLALTLFIGNRIKSSLNNTFLGKVDALAGGALGVFKYAFCLSVIIWLSTSLKVTLPSNWVAGSYIYPHVSRVAPGMANLTGNVIPFFKEIFRQF